MELDLYIFGYQLIRSTKYLAGKINVRVAKHSTDTLSLNVVLRKILLDTKFEKAGPLKCRYYSFLPVEWPGAR